MASPMLSPGGGGRGRGGGQERHGGGDGGLAGPTPLRAEGR